MRSKSLHYKEEGYLLLESLFTLAILIVVITAICPLIVNWLGKHNTAKNIIEENRHLYESSMSLHNEALQKMEANGHTIQLDKYRIRIEETGTEVVIYESIFEK